MSSRTLPFTPYSSLISTTSGHIYEKEALNNSQIWLGLTGSSQICESSSPISLISIWILAGPLKPPPTGFWLLCFVLVLSGRFWNLTARLSQRSVKTPIGKRAGQPSRYLSDFFSSAFIFNLIFIPWIIPRIWKGNKT